MYARYIPPDPVEIVPAITADQGSTSHPQRKRKAIEARNGPAARSVNPPKRPKNTHEEVRKDFEGPTSASKTNLEGVDAKSPRRDKKERRGREKARKVPVTTGADAGVENQLGYARATLSESLDRDRNSRLIPGATNSERQRMIDEAEKHASILSKFQISRIAARKVAEDRPPNESDHDLVDNAEEATPELHGLTPLPQIDPDSVKKQLPTYSALPSWLANPIRVSASDRVPFQDLKLGKRLLRVLESKGYADAFAVQSALLPLLLDGGGHSTGDVCVSAATGSGKTLAYILPIVESLRHRVVTKLRALIVVPTRELVTQVRETCELCQSGSSLQVATAVGSRQLKVEQELLIRRTPIYNEDGYIARTRQRMKDLGSDDYDPSMDDLQEEDILTILPDHDIEYTSRVDILICTPGRLVDHIRSTRGFTLDDLQWLVIDEADRLLSQSFQEWITITMNLLDRERATSELRADQRILQLMENRPIKSNVRKIVLSATMTRDVGQLSVLKLKKPRLVVVDNERATKTNELTGQVEVSEPEPSGGSFDLPATLQESAVFVRDESEKPLYLLQLLREYILRQPLEKTEHGKVGMRDSCKENHESSNKINSPSDSSSSEGSSSNSDTDTDTKLHSLKPTVKSSELEGTEVVESTTYGVLIFTKSNASAVRLGRLLTLLHPPFDKVLSTLTSTQASSQRRKTLKSFVSGSLSVLVASDLVSRGMDIPNLAHVVNYDLPSTVRGYLHRVGRTARAGKSGCAWTLVTARETKWFWSSIGRGKEMRRARDRIVRKVNVDMEAVEEAARKGYTDALSALGEEVRAD